MHKITKKNFRAEVGVGTFRVYSSTEVTHEDGSVELLPESEFTSIPLTDYDLLTQTHTIRVTSEALYDMARMINDKFTSTYTI